MTAHVAGMPAHENLVAEEPRRPGPVRRSASAGRRVAKATLYTFAIVFVTGIFVGLLMGMNSAYADDGGGSGGDGGSSSAGSSASSGGDGGSSSSGGDGGSSASSGDSGSSSSAGDSSSGGDSSSSTGAGVSSVSTGGGDTSSSANGGDSSASVSNGDSSSASAGPGDSTGTNGDTANEGSPSTSGEDSSAADTPGTTRSVTTRSDTPSTTVSGESTSVDGVSVSNVSVDAPDPSGFALGIPNADAGAVATSARPGEDTAAQAPAETTAQSSETQTADPNTAAAVPGTVVDNAPSFLSAADLATLAAVAQVGLDEDPAGVPAQQNPDEAVTTPVPGIVVDNTVSFLSPEDLSAIRALAQVGAIDETAPPVANPDEVIAAGVPGIVVDDAPSFLSPEDLAAVREAQQVGLDEDPAGYFQPITTVEDELGRHYVIGIDVSVLKKGLGARIGVQFDPPAITLMARAWPVAKPLGFQAYALSMPGVKPGLESVDFFAQAQTPINPFASPKPTVTIGEGPVVVGVEGAFSPFQTPENRFTISDYVAGQLPFKDTPIGAAWGIAMDHYNPITGSRTSDEGHGWGIGGMTGAAVGVRGAIGLSGLTGSSSSRSGRTK